MINLLSSLEIDRDDPHFWELVDEEISIEMRRDEEELDLDYDPDLNEQIRKEAYLIEIDGDEVHIGVDYGRYFNIVGQAFED